MPPKKKHDSGAVGIYDVEIMNEDELKQYIEALKEESERMKSSFIDNQRNKKEVEDMLQNTQEDILNRYETLMQKEIEMQQLLVESNDTLKDEYKMQIIKELESNKQLAQSVIDSFIEVQKARMFQQDELKEIQEYSTAREREVDNIKLANRLISIDLKEQTEEEWNDIIEKRKSMLENISEEFKEKYREERWKLFEEKEKIMNTISNDLFGKESEKYPSTDETEKMSLYFKDIFLKNIKASANLKVKVESLEKELNKLRMLLKDAEHENKELLKDIEEKKDKTENDELTDSEVDDSYDKQLDYLNYENYALHEKLRQVIGERDVLKGKFISAMRNIYKKADFASFLAEQMIVSTLTENQEYPDQVSLQEKEQEAVFKAPNFNKEYDEIESDSKSSSITF